MAKKPATYWLWDVQTYFDGGKGCSVHSGEPTLERAMAAAYRDASYYILECGYEATITISERCVRCEGTCSVTIGKRSPHERTCPSCRGKGRFQTIGPFDVEVHHVAAETV
jgi:hypothetical protein